MKGGARPGAGRPRGSRTKKKAEAAAAAAAAGLTPAAFLLQTMRDVTLPLATRMDAARAVIPSTTPRLNAVSIDLRELTDDDLRRAAR